MHAISFASTGTHGADRRSLAGVPEHIVLPEELTGVRATIIVALGNRFPMITAHKVLAAYGCLIPRLVSGAFDVTRHRAVWPSTGNYCRGGVAIARLLGCRSVAVLPEGMSRERFNWLEEWVVDPGRHPSHAGNGEQCQGDLRCLPCPREGPAEPDPQPVLGIRQLHCSSRSHGTGAGADIPGARRRRKQDCASVRLCIRLGRNARGRRLPENDLSAPIRASSKRWNARLCSTTAMASTTFRASATSTCRSFTT